MAGVKITQLRSQMATGRRYGSFAGKPEAEVGRINRKLTVIGVGYCLAFFLLISEAL